MSASSTSGLKTVGYPSYGTITGASSSAEVTTKPSTPNSSTSKASESDVFLRTRNPATIDWLNSSEIPRNASERVAYYMAHMPLTDPDRTAEIRGRIERTEQTLANVRETKLKEDFNTWAKESKNTHLNMDNPDDFMTALLHKDRTSSHRLLHITNNRIGQQEAILKASLHNHYGKEFGDAYDRANKTIEERKRYHCQQEALQQPQETRQVLEETPKKSSWFKSLAQCFGRR